MPAGQAVVHSGMIETGCGLPAVIIVTTQAEIRELIAVFIDMAGYTVFIQTEESSLWISGSVLCEPIPLESGPMTVQALLFSVIPDQGVTCEGMVKHPAILWPVNQVSVTTAMFGVAGGAVFFLHFVGEMIAFPLLDALFQSGMAGEAFFRIQFALSKFVTSGAFRNTLLLLVETGKLTG